MAATVAHRKAKRSKIQKGNEFNGKKKTREKHRDDDDHDDDNDGNGHDCVRRRVSIDNAVTDHAHSESRIDEVQDDDGFIDSRNEDELKESMNNQNLQNKLLQEYIAAADRLSECVSSSQKSEASTALCKAFQRRGLKIRKGRWSLQEKKLLHENFASFVKEHEHIIGNPVDFIVHAEDVSRRREVKRLKMELGFIRSMSQGLFRERRFIVNHIVFTLDPLAVSNGQHFSPEDMETLKQLVETHGRKWTIISREMGRSVASVQSAHRNFFLHTGYTRQRVTKKQLRKLAKRMEAMYSELDLTRQIPHKVPWNNIADDIGHYHGKYLQMAWDRSIKYRNEKGKLRLKMESRSPPLKLIRKVARSIARSKPTHIYGIDWEKYYAKLSPWCGSHYTIKLVYRTLMLHNRIDYERIGMAEAAIQLERVLRRQKKLGFERVWKQSIQMEPLPIIQWQRYHWALSPQLAHYVHDLPVMHWGYRESDDHGIKQEVEEVW